MINTKFRNTTVLLFSIFVLLLVILIQEKRDGGIFSYRSTKSIEEAKQAELEKTKQAELQQKIAIAPEKELTEAEWFAKGRSLHEAGDLRGAINAYARVISMNRRNVGAFFYRANAYSALGNKQRAIKDYDKVIKLDPRYSEAYNNRGNAYNALGDKQQAIKDYGKAIVEPRLCGRVL